jgi:hypothetical protein
MKPVLQALVLAEHVYTDVSGKKIIAGTFNIINIRRFSPEQVKAGQNVLAQQMGSPWAYLSLTDVVDKTKIALQFVNVSTHAVLFHTEIQILNQDRLATVEIVMPLPQLMLFMSGPGTYSLDALWEGEPLGSHRIDAKDVHSDEKPPSNNGTK